MFALFGMSRFTTRLVAAFFMLGATLMFVVLLREYMPAKGIRQFIFLLLGALLFLGLPWSFHLGRVAFELATFPVVLLVSIWSLRRLSVITTTHVEAKKENQLLQLIFWLLFSASQGILFYTYTVGRFLAPVLFCFAVILFYKKLRFRQVMIGILLFCLLLVPAVQWEMEYPGSLLSRYKTVANSNLQVVDVAILYVRHFSPYFLFGVGDGNVRHEMLDTGPFVWLTFPLLIVGAIYLCKNEKKQFILWVIAGILISPIPGLLTIPSPHILRSISLLVFFSYLIGLGFVKIWKDKKAIFLVLVFIEMGTILFSYFQNYSIMAQPWFLGQTVVALEKHISKQSQQFEQQHYIISNSLYPGSYATGYFAYAQKNNQSIEDTRRLVRAITISERVLHSLQNGTVFLSAAECRRFQYVLAKEFELVEQKTDLCVWKKQ